MLQNSLRAPAQNRARCERAFFRSMLAMCLGNLPKDCLQATESKKPRYFLNSRVSNVYLGWLMGHHLPTSNRGLARLPIGCNTVMCDSKCIKNGAFVLHL